MNLLISRIILHIPLPIGRYENGKVLGCLSYPKRNFVLLPSDIAKPCYPKCHYQRPLQIASFLRARPSFGANDTGRENKSGIKQINLTWNLGYTGYR
jgi:hypothetical protein